MIKTSQVIGISNFKYFSLLLMKQMFSFCDKTLKETTIKVHHVKSEKKEHKEKKENNHIKWSSNKSLTLSNR